MARVGWSIPISSSATTRRPLAGAGYCRAARRLRHCYRNDPRRLVQSLRGLSAEADAQAELAPPMMRPIANTGGPAGQFAALVARSLDGPVLRYSQRLALLRQAAIVGIGRFEANLIIAAVQHGVAGTPPVTQDRPRRSWWAVVLLAAAVQGGIVAGVGWVLGG